MYYDDKLNFKLKSKRSLSNKDTKFQIQKLNKILLIHQKWKENKHPVIFHFKMCKARKIFKV